jgi:sialate O-acetylesterase
MTVNIDTAHNGAEGADLHPNTKLEVGHRLADVALAKYYGGKGAGNSPTFDSSRQDGNSIRIHFRSASSSLICRGGIVKGFAIAGEDQKFRWASAEILPNGNELKIWNEDIPHPVAVRYAWADNPDCNLYGSNGLPAAPFRTDNWRSPFIPPKR